MAASVVDDPLQEGAAVAVFSSVHMLSAVLKHSDRRSNVGGKGECPTTEADR